MSVNLVSFAKALADDTRQEIMAHLCCVWLNVGEIVTKLEGKVNQSTVSHHLKKLQEANLVLTRQDGREHYYTLNEESIALCCGRLMLRFAPQRAEHIIRVEDLSNSE